ncbi:MAG TPA: substrate-binding domain-containing protein [Solirubrobacterales bacterium]|nr:substrate-binding domain-containing protein [Solirubrobacterales bacterium]
MNNALEERAASIRRRGVLFAGVLALVCALGVLHASGAAALGEQCSGSNAKGLGAFLQDRAHERWATSELGFNGSSNPLACSGSQGSGGTPGVGYVPVASGTALRAWGADDGVLHTEEFGFPFQFVGTDIAPSGPVGEEGTMLARMKAALDSDIVVVPVTQTSIAIVASPPALPAHPVCTVPRISAGQLQKVFSGELKNWRQLGAASDPALGGDCDQAITRIVRDENAGTTYQLKHYLDSVNPAPLDCTGETKRTWSQLQSPFSGASPPNLEWPQNSDCQEGEGPVTTVAGNPVSEGEIGLLSYVNAHPGTITYASFPEAQRWASKRIVNIHNGVKFAHPGTGEGDANCGAAKYTRPAGWESGVNLDWSQVYGSDPNIGEVAKNAYPICTLTWAVAATDRFSEKVATTVHDYLAFAVAKEGGQAIVQANGYRDLPAPIANAANAAIAHIDGKEGEEEEGGGEEGTVLCKSEPEVVEGILTCPTGQGFSGKVTGGVVPKSAATFKSVEGPEVTVTCPQGEYVGEFNEDGTSAGNGVSAFEFGLKEGCTTTFPEEPEAIVSFENPPYDASRFTYTNPLGPQGVFTLAKANEGQPLLRIQSGPVCIYLPADISAQVFNGSPTTMVTGGKWQLAEEAPEGACPTLLTHFAQLTVTRVGEGLPLYIAGK